ncbi:hypothetical protein QF032_000958 [Streptomyces achromogenes]|nr:hypothetical protein [Streptomyces achromogenes]
MALAGITTGVQAGEAVRAAHHDGRRPDAAPPANGA